MHLCVTNITCRKSEERLRRNASVIAEKRAGAASDVRLMTATVERKRAAEEQRGGLVIIEARYGILDEPIVDTEYPPWIDATIPLQYLVEDSQLIIHPGPKSALLGLYDPRIDEDKDLLVRYGYFNDLQIDRKSPPTSVS